MDFEPFNLEELILNSDDYRGTSMYEETLERVRQDKLIAEFRAQNPEYADAPEEWIEKLI